MRLDPDTGKPLEPTPERGYGLHWRRRIRGRSLAKEQTIPLGRDEMLPKEQCIAGLRKIVFASPKGCRKPLARLLKIDDRNLRSWLKGKGTMPEAVRRRVSAFVVQHARGEISLERISVEATPQSVWRAGKPSHHWVRTITTTHHDLAEQWLKDVAEDAKDTVFHDTLARSA